MPCTFILSVCVSTVLCWYRGLNKEFNECDKIHVTSGISFDQIRAGIVIHKLISLYEDTTEDNDYNDSPFIYSHIKCKQFEP